ncbi:hypothetical protein [Actinomadura madurae]|uniref:hypothetical protein n=1 Tax=Actinomadura madurae TaxID=1993 RepID=UPI003555F5BD
MHADGRMPLERIAEHAGRRRARRAAPAGAHAQRRAGDPALRRVARAVRPVGLGHVLRFPRRAGPALGRAARPHPPGRAGGELRGGSVQRRGRRLAAVRRRGARSGVAHEP